MDQQTPFGLTLLVDKPLHWTSFDLVNKLRYAAKSTTGKKKFKVGHAGTLDPLATGIMIICFGAHTKTIERLTGLNKSYEGTITLGATTPSYDLETEVDKEFHLPPNDPELLQEAAASFLGEQDQMPPIFSAKKIDGKKAYELARKGRDVKMRPSKITIESFEVSNADFPNINFKVSCSKGTYIRSLAHDFGKKLESGAHLTRLSRTSIGSFHLKNAHSIEQAIAKFDEAYRIYTESLTDK